ncbi:glycosyltransferase family 2 protein [Confluentibacter citreus]|uniref:glycosyltransferase family 2 protein n=1 Tax=Confluentibacter citreus TaxID=2007307 RepID=UPI0012FD9715|nr:glycosyltransferase family A protein [Confluentibacter citreus]
MNREDLAFLNKIFGNNNFKDYQILIINQTTPKKLLKSDFKNIRVINSFDLGLTKSRNLAIVNAIGDICLIADDDVEYVLDFDKIIISSFSALKHASAIRFRIGTFTGKDYKNYPLKSKRLINKKDIIDASSIEIAFKRNEIINKISFNTFFGLGSYFTCGEEYLFLKEMINKKLQVYYQNDTIVKHSFERSTDNIAGDDFVKAQAALYYHDYKNLSYLLLIKFIFFLLRKSMISYSQILDKYNKGLSGITIYKKLERENPLD